MNISFKSNRLKKSLTKPKEIKREYGILAKKTAQRMSDFQAANNLHEISKLPGARLHRLSGKRKDEYAVNISSNYRIIFVLDHNPIPKLEDGSLDLFNVSDIKIVDIEDYH